MAAQTAQVRKVAFLVENGFSEADYADAVSILEKDGWFTRIIGPGGQSVRGWKGGAWGNVFAVSGGIEDITVGDYGLLVIPGGRRSVEKLKLQPGLTPRLQAFLASKRPVIVYNHAVELLLGGAEIVNGRAVAGPEELAIDIRTVGGEWTEASSAASGDLLTLSSRNPAFNKEIRSFLKKLTVQEGPAGEKDLRAGDKQNKAA
ncbi:MAG: DJ-1/PfpI family protein [Alphaproteobacteria bacterium]|nr:DJ-1/PfpI family protein [Alphaproteobacteria bacterium]